MPKSGCSERAVEVGSATRGVFPVSTSMLPSLCDDISWCSERTIENLSAICAWSGMYSQISMPGTLVRMGLSGPRYSCGASGFMSYVSSWLGPPHIQKRMTEVLREVSAARARARNTSARLTPPKASMPTRRNSLRRIGPRQSRVMNLFLPCESHARLLMFQRYHALAAAASRVVRSLRDRTGLDVICEPDRQQILRPQCRSARPRIMARSSVSDWPIPPGHGVTRLQVGYYTSHVHLICQGSTDV